MKSLVKSSITLIFFLMFSVTHSHAQKTSETFSFIGKWSLVGTDAPNINDTITLTKELLNEYKYPTWVFKDPDKLQIIHYYDVDNSGKPKVAVSDNQDMWSYDARINQLKILSDKQENYFKIIFNDNQTVKLIRTK